MKKYFEEKAHQVDFEKNTAFGIPFLSRYCKAGEIAEMLNFAALCAKNNITHYVKNIFYDGQDGYCRIDFVDIVKEGDLVEAALFECAKLTISMLSWGESGTIYHPFVDEDEGAI